MGCFASGEADMGTTYAVGLDSYKSNNRASSIYTCSIHSTWVLVRALPKYRTLELQHPGIDYIKPASPWISCWTKSLCFALTEKAAPCLTRNRRRIGRYSSRMIDKGRGRRTA